MPDQQEVASRGLSEAGSRRGSTSSGKPDLLLSGENK